MKGQGLKMQGRIVGLTVGLVISSLVGCSTQTNADLSSSTSPSSAVSRAANPSPTLTAQTFPNPIAPASTAIQPVPVPNLIPAVTVPEHLPGVSLGRPDPFAALDISPTIVAKADAATIPASSVGLGYAQPIASTTIPTVTVSALPSTPMTMQSLPRLQPAPTNLNQQLPAANAPTLLAPPLSMAQAIEISGVVQTGNKTSIIVKVPDEQSSRYVSVGDYLANGRVLVKRVVMGSEPTVILEQDGKEISRYVGGSGKQQG